MIKEIAPYSLGKELGKGGNASVFLARCAVGPDVALKVLRADRRKGSEPFKRFESEIALLKQLRGTPGVMPLLDSGETTGRPWFTMPVAVPLREALKEASLSAIVGAFEVFARTLANLADLNIHHRDIKPENLFCLSPENWIIGDFGIHEGPENPELTRDGRRIGPALYCAQEMLDYHQQEDHSRADVFSLAKTLWVIATGQKLPLQGQHPEGFRGAWLENYRTEPNTAPLDRLLIRATAILAGERITMRQFENELGAWLSPPLSDSRPTDLADIGALLVDPYRRATNDLLELSEKSKKINGVVQLAASSLAIVEKSLRTLGGGAIVNGASISNSAQMSAALGRGIGVRRDLISTYVSLLSPGGIPPYLHSGLLFIPESGSKVTIRAGHVLCLDKPIRNQTVLLFEMTESVDVDSLLVPEILNNLCERLLPPLRDAVIKFAATMND